jgi:four helix bundle protein
MKKPWDLRERTMWFAINVIRFCRDLPRTAEAAEIANQLRRAAGSTGAHYSASKRARSNKDFISKMDGAIEESDEAMFWLNVLLLSEITRDPRAGELRSEANELVSIFVASRTTAVLRAKQQNQKKRQMNRKNGAY